jgi:hypothetical protein
MESIQGQSKSIGWDGLSRSLNGLAPSDRKPMETELPARTGCFFIFWLFKSNQLCVADCKVERIDPQRKCPGFPWAKRPSMLAFETQ